MQTCFYFFGLRTNREALFSLTVSSLVCTQSERVWTCVTRILHSPSAKHVCVYVTSHLIHSQHGSGAKIVASRKSGTVIASRNTGIETCCLVERRAPSGKRGAGSSGRRWCQACQERKRSSRTVTVAELGIKRGQPSVDTRVEVAPRANKEIWVTMSTPEEQVTMAVQQLYVRLQQFQGTLATILRSARNELVKQVQNATSTTTLRSYLGAVDQRNKLEPTTTEESSTPRPNATLSTQMYFVLVMTKTLYRCRNAGVNEGFAGWRQLVREWEAKFVGLLRNVLSCRRKDDIPTQLVETEDQFNTECHKALAGKQIRWARNHRGHGHVRSNRSDDRSRRLWWMDSAGCGQEQEMLWSQEWTCWMSVWITKGEWETNQGACEHREVGCGGNHNAGDQSSSNRDRLRRVAGRCGEKNAWRSSCVQKQRGRDTSQRA